jgi:hypothetical protein
VIHRNRIGYRLQTLFFIARTVPPILCAGPNRFCSHYKKKADPIGGGKRPIGEGMLLSLTNLRRNMVEMLDRLDASVETDRYDRLALPRRSARLTIWFTMRGFPCKA